MIHAIDAGEAGPKVLVISASTRPLRIAPQVSRWVMERLPAQVDLDLELVDLADWPLPDDEAAIPATGEYAHEHTLAWSRKVAGAAGFVFVTPQYNWGYPAALKNALDHLYEEWRGKPAMIVTYGFHGGGRCAAQLRQVLEGGLRMRPTSGMPALTLPEAMKPPVCASVDCALEAFSGENPAVEQAFAELATLLAGCPPAP